MTEAGIDAGFTRDLFVALGEPLEGGEAWSVRIQFKPFIRWIWLGTIFMAVGGLLAALDKRYRKVARKTADKAVDVPGAASHTGTAPAMARASEPSGGAV